MSRLLKLSIKQNVVCSNIDMTFLMFYNTMYVCFALVYVWGVHCILTCVFVFHISEAAVCSLAVNFNGHACLHSSALHMLTCQIASTLTYISLSVYCKKSWYYIQENVPCSNLDMTCLILQHTFFTLVCACVCGWVLYFDFQI